VGKARSLPLSSWRLWPYPQTLGEVGSACKGQTRIKTLINYSCRKFHSTKQGILTERELTSSLSYLLSLKRLKKFYSMQSSSTKQVCARRSTKLSLSLQLAFLGLTSEVNLMKNILLTLVWKLYLFTTQKNNGYINKMV